MSIRILLVEDNDPLRDWLARILDRAGHAVTQAADGEQALTLLQQTGEHRVPFDVVITDIMMGDVDGVRVTQAARSLENTPEVILLTSHGSIETASKAIRLGAFDYMQKPIQPHTLLSQVTAAAALRAERLRQADEAAAWRAVADVVNKVQPNEAPAATGAVAAKPERYLAVGQLHVDTQRREVWFDREQVAVTPIEYTILVSLAEASAVVMTYGELVQRTHAIAVSEREAYGLLRTHVRNLRHKIERSYLISVRGVGYMLDASAQAEDDVRAPGG
ncbi:MAG: response regulator transcription factor [Roseiflexaceae bacterium]|nr:response regulator transcription factor [Roseiflexaceae bacterium]